jgi:hypothetical protein
MADEFKTISVSDPAIDWVSIPQDTVGAYLRTREFALIEPYLKPGSTPTIFVLREIPDAQWEGYVEVDNVALKYRRAFQCAVLRVEGLETPEGFALAADGLVKRKLLNDEALSDEDCKRFAPSERLEIGAVAYQRSFFPKRIGADFQLPPMWLEQWERVVRHRAAQNRALPAHSNSGAPQPTQDAGSNSDSPTDATAQERSQAAA